MGCPVLVGRTADVQVLVHLLDQVRGGAGQTALITGEAGIGKTRLVAEVKQRCRGLGLGILEGHCFEPDRALPYAPVLDMLHSLCAIHSPGELTLEFGPVAPELVRLLPEWASLLPEPVPPQCPSPDRRGAAFLKRSSNS